MAKTHTSTPASGILLLIVGLLAGFVGGYAVARHGMPAAPARYDLGTQATTCPHALDPEDAPVLEGLVCPSPGCNNLLLNDHCAVGHNIQDHVKQLLRDGKSHEEARQEIIAEYYQK